MRNPHIALREFNRLYYRRLYTREYNETGVDIFAEDWDNLVLLDACRYDLFEAEHDLPGRLESRHSRGSSTVEFLTANFRARDLTDVVYVTANPQLYRHPSISPSLHAELDVWREKGWNEEYRTVLPETLTEYALETTNEYPNKRLLVHYIQPHYPFIGPTGRKHFDLDSLAFWKQVRNSEISVSREILWEAYRENLQLALPHVRDLVDRLQGKSVVTADHGQAIGERVWPVPIRCYGHPEGVYIDSLVKVPWLVDDRGERKTIEKSEAHTVDHVDEDVVSSRLEQLGYVN